MALLVPDQTLLGLLALKPSYGYELLEHFRDKAKLGEVWDLSTSQLYAVLKRLEAQGLTIGREVFVPDAPARTEFDLTDAGREALYNWLHEHTPSPSVRRVRVEFLSRLYILRLLNLPTQHAVQAQKLACANQLDSLLQRREAVDPGIGRLTIELVIAQLGAIISWLDRCELVPLPDIEDLM